MITNFALSLSFDGIELLHRVPRGWRRVGQVNVESETLDADLKALREKALLIEPDGLRTKLIIPLDQIKYIALDTTQTTDDDIHGALEGATPYALNELVIDNERFGGRTHIAAVARETLQEAEAFAAAHGFQPVAFVAIPEPFTFQKEVFFGPTEMARSIVGPDALIERDDLPVMIVGTRIKSRLLVFDLPEEVQEEVYKDDLAALLSDEKKAPKAVEKKEEPEPETAAPEPTAEDPDTVEPAPEVKETSSEVEKPEPEVEEPAPVVEELEPEVETATREVAELTVSQPEPTQAIWIDHIPAEYHAPAEEVVEVADEPAPAKIPLIPVDPVFAAPKLLDPVIAEYHPRPKATPKAPLVAVSATSAHTAPKLAAVPPAANRTQPPQPAAARSKPALMAAGIAAAVLLFGGVIWSQQDRPPSTTGPAPPAETAEVVPETPAPASVEPEPVLEAGPAIPSFEITEFGSQDATSTDVPTLSAETPAAPLSAPPSITAAEADPAMSSVQAPPAPPPQETAQASVGAPVLRGQVLSPDEASRVYEATGVWLRAPRFLDVPTGIIAFEFLPPAGTTPPDRIAQPIVPPLEGLDTDLSFVPPANPPAPEIVFPRDADGFILATEEGTVTPEGAVVFAGLPDLAITPRPELTEDDLNRMALLAPAPEGVVIIAGRPENPPPLRPADARLPEVAQNTETQEVIDATVAADAPEVEDLPPGSVGIAGLELQDSGAVALDTEVIESRAIVDLRPRLRPQGLSDGVDPGTPDITDILAGIETDDATLRFDNSTALAVVLSPRPDVRPGNFGNVVAAALARQQTRTVAPAAPAAPTAPVVAAAPVPPQNTGPIPGGVARAATQEDAIRLREINLIGVYGRPNARRALVRLSNGRYVRVEVGSALDGGQVTAIGDNALNYVKRGRTLAIEMP